jgi:hypothetical protein
MDSQTLTPNLKIFFHELNNHLAIMDAFFSIVDAGTLDKEKLKLYNYACHSFREVVALIARQCEQLSR